METLKREWPVLAGVAALAVILLWLRTELGFFESVNALVFAIFWSAVACAALRGLYLPVQYLSHRAALRKVIAREGDLTRRAEASDAVATVSLSIRSLRPDPRETPWWRWRLG